MTDKLVVKIKQIDGDVAIPKYQTSGSVGCDVHAAHNMTIHATCRELIGTGLFLEIPPGWEAQVRPRSGLAINCGVTVLNSPGTIDSDFRHEIKVILYNSSDERVFIKKGDRIAQLVFVPAFQAVFEEVEELSTTDRAGGFGSTGK